MIFASVFIIQVLDMSEITKELYMKLKDLPTDKYFYPDVESVLRFGKLNCFPKPVISFVIPTYRRVDLLSETLASVLQQKTTVPYEIIVTDNSMDLSEDNPTYQLIRKINSEKILYYVNKKNLGQAGNWNRGIYLARGKYVSMVHDDDLIIDDYLPQMVKCLKVAERAASPLGVIQTRFNYFSNSIDLPKLFSKKRGGVKRFYKINALAVTGIGPTGCPTCGMLFNREAVLSVGGFNPEYYPAHDYVLGYMLLRAGYSTFVTEDVLGYYRIAQNETMKPDILKTFCKCDYYFREFLYSENVWTRAFGAFYRNVQYTLNVDGLVKRSRKFHQEIPPEDFLFTEGYSKYLKLQEKLYLKQREFIDEYTSRVYHD